MSEQATTSRDMAGLLLCDDFIWISRITGTANALGLRVIPARTAEQLEALAREAQPKCVIFDLEAATAIADIVRRIKAACPAAPRFVAFGSHVDTQSLRAAREAGCEPVLPRSQFAERLPELLKEWLS